MYLADDVELFPQLNYALNLERIMMNINMIYMTSCLVDDVVLFPLLNYALNLERIVINITLDLYDVIKDCTSPMTSCCSHY